MLVRTAGLIPSYILPMREASKAAANAVASIGNDRSVREIPSCLSYRPAIEIETVTTEREENLANLLINSLYSKKTMGDYSKRKLGESSYS